MPDASTYQRAKAIFLEICDAPQSERGALLSALCGQDEALRLEVESLLEHDAQQDDDIRADLLPPGARIGSYEVLRVIGTGAMGIVYEARQAQPSRLVALKLIRGMASAPTLRRRFLHEAAALARLQHPGIATIYEAGIDEASGAPYFAMEYIQGVPLDEYARVHAPQVEQRLTLLAEIASAVHHAHQRGVIHRDLKPANILIDDEGHPKILDFGIARMASQEQGATHATVVGQVLGTLAYMSPEQAAGDPDSIDARADVYALGAVGYELLGGVPPIDTRTKPMPEALRAIQNDSPRKLGTIDKRLRGDIETIIATAIEKDPARRYASAAALAEDIRRALRLEPIFARPATTMYQLRTFARRRRGLVATGAATALLLLLASIVSVTFAIQAERQRRLAERRLGEVRALANTMLFELHDKIEFLPGAIEARRELVQTAIRYLDSIASDAGSDQTLIAELAEGYFRIGDILGNPRRANLGDARAAISSYEQSIRYYQQLPPNPANLVSLARARIAVGEALTSTQDAADAIEHYQAALTQLDPFDSKEADGLRVLAAQRIGSSLLNMGRTNDAIQHYRTAADASQRLAQDGDPDVLRRYSIALNELAMALHRADRGTEAMPHLERSLAIRTAAAQANPIDVRAQRDLALVYHRMGDLHAALGDDLQRIEYFSNARDILSAIASESPADARARFDASVAEEKLGMALLYNENPADAQTHLNRAVALREELTSANPENHMYRMSLPLSMGLAGQCALKLKDYELAERTYRRVIELCQACIEVDPSDSRMWTMLGLAQQGLARTYFEQPMPRLQEAQANLLESITTFASMEQAGMQPYQQGMNEEELKNMLDSIRKATH